MAAEVVCIASWNVDLVARVARPIARGETVVASAFDTSPGGKGSNAAIAAARQGAQVAVIARVGGDDFGKMALSVWQRESIDVSLVEIAHEERSGVAQILVYDDGDNSIAVYAGANAGLSRHNAACATGALSQARVVLASLEVPVEATREAFRIAQASGATTVLNPAPARPLGNGLLDHVDVLTPNEAELRTLVGVDADTDAASAARMLLERGAKAVMVTLGRAGCALYGVDRERHALAGHGVDVVDTIGAGDTFNGALAAALARGESLEQAMHWANAAAALSVTGRGATRAMPTRVATAEFLRRSEAST